MTDGVDGVDASMVQLLVDERAILRTLHRYGHAMDAGREEEWVSLFTPDAVFDVVLAAAGAAVHREEGHDDLAAYIAGYPKPPNVKKHIVLDPIIEVDGDTATVASYWLALSKNVDGTVSEGYGRYDDELVRVEGRWRIRHRRAEVESWRRWTPEQADLADGGPR